MASSPISIAATALVVGVAATVRDPVADVVVAPRCIELVDGMMSINVPVAVAMIDVRPRVSSDVCIVSNAQAPIGGVDA